MNAFRTHSAALRHAALALLLTLPATALAQETPRIWDIELGIPVEVLPAREFVEPACGSNGGPAGLPIGRFEEFRKCPAEASGLREIAFIYDDIDEYVARARGDPAIVARYRATVVLAHPVLLSLLISDDGRVRGYRIFTDPRVDPELRSDAYTIANAFKARFGPDWTCTDLPPAAGERPLGGIFLKQTCTAANALRKATVDSRSFYREGQEHIDPITQQPMVNAFESRAWVEVIQPEPYADASARVDAEGVADEDAATPEERFFAGLTNDCPDCELPDADLRRRDLSEADLSGANLRGAILHRAVLRRANLSGAHLEEANLNRAVLVQADLRGANLEAAMLYEIDASRADFSGANLNLTSLKKARLALANLAGAQLILSTLWDARVNDADLSGAVMHGADASRAVLFRSNLSDVQAEEIIFSQAVLHDADLRRSTMPKANFSGADLSEADLSNADFSGARLLAANLQDTLRTGTNFSGAIMPNNTVER